MKILLYVVLLTLSLSVKADIGEVEIDVGGVPISIKAPNGFREIILVSPETRKIMETLTPPTNRLLAGFVSEEDFGRIMKDEEPDFNRYIMLQSNRNLENRNFSKEQFQMLTRQLKEQQNTILQEQKSKVEKLLEGASKSFADDFDTSVDIKMGEQITLGIFNDKPNTIGLMSLAKYSGEVGNDKFDYIMAGGVSFVLARGKLIYVYVFSLYESQNDIDWVKSKSRELISTL